MGVADLFDEDVFFILQNGIPWNRKPDYVFGKNANAPSHARFVLAHAIIWSAAAEGEARRRRFCISRAKQIFESLKAVSPLRSATALHINPNIGFRIKTGR